MNASLHTMKNNTRTLLKKSKQATNTVVNTSPIRVVVLDDHDIVRSGLCRVLDAMENISVVGSASNQEQLLELCHSKTIDIVLMDISIGTESGLDIVQVLLSTFPTTKAIALTAHDDYTHLKQFMDKGGSGYLYKGISDDELYNALHRVNKGEQYISRHMNDTLMKYFLSNDNETKLEESSEKNAKKSGTSNINSNITRREIEIIKLISTGMTSIEIGEHLYISARTVETHRKNIMQKLGIHNSAGIVRYALKNFPQE